MHVACFTSSLVFFSVKKIGFGSLSAQRFDDIFLDFYTRRWASFLVNFLYQTLLFRFLGFRLRNNGLELIVAVSAVIVIPTVLPMDHTRAIYGTIATS